MLNSVKTQNALLPEKRMCMLWQTTILVLKSLI